MDHRFEPHELVQDSEIFGPALLRVRKALDVSRKGLGEHALVASSTLATYETEARDPSVEAIVGIAVACGVEPWSAAQHGHLLLSNRAMRSDTAGKPRLFLPPTSSRKTASLASRHATGAAGVGAGVAAGTTIAIGLPAVAIALAGAAVASAVRQKRGEVGPFEVSDMKLMARAQSATPLPGAVERGVYPLVAPKDRATLEQDLIEASRKLSDDELMALVAALHPDEMSPDTNS